jgi:DNA-damage-inducible protein J
MPKDIQINIHLESRLRDEAEKVLGKLGVSLGEAVKIFLSQVVLQKGFPFEVKIPNQETINAFKQTKRDKDKLKTYDSPKELFEEMDKW